MENFKGPHLGEMIEEADYNQLNYAIHHSADPSLFTRAVGNLNTLCYCLGVLGVTENLRPSIPIGCIESFDEMVRQFKLEAARLRMETRRMM